MASRSQHVSTNNSNPDHHNNTTSTSEIEVGDTPVDGLAVTTSTNLSVSKSERTNQNSSLPQISPSNSVGLTQVPAAPSSYITNANLELTKAGSHIHTDTKSNIQTDHRYKKVVNSNTEAQSQPVTEKQTSKNNSDSHVDSGVVLPKRISQMNESERKLWCLTDSNANDCIEDIVSLVQTLVAEFSLEGKAFQIYSPLIDLVGNALLFAKCCEQNRRKVAEILVECGWVEFLMLQTETLLTQVDLAADGWKNDIIISKTDILLQGLTTLTFIINQSSKETVCKMKNNLAKDLLKLLKHKDLETAASNSLEYQVFTRLIQLLGDLVLAEAFSQVMLNGVQLEVEELMLKYLEGTQSKDVRLLSQSILSHITHDDTTPRFSIEYMSKLSRQTSLSATSSVCSTCCEEAGVHRSNCSHVQAMANDLGFQCMRFWQFMQVLMVISCTWFMERVVIFSTYEKCSSDVRSRVFQTVVKDVRGSGLSRTFHQTLMSSLDHYNLETAGELSAFLIESALNNLLSALLTIHNGTDVCKNRKCSR
ncbi:hypothetical protein EB796_012477 [Bugula neritina]|uniref:Uncharacterized protein n=1 Tax=Bugula neritina TaxID=10212 RepID=A0A7J7JV82_BUGNE|nr:hypothetical protein EB796_012477 [Bugula neritina]